MGARLNERHSDITDIRRRGYTSRFTWEIPGEVLEFMTDLEILRVALARNVNTTARINPKSNTVILSFTDDNGNTTNIELFEADREIGPDITRIIPEWGIL